MPFPWKRGMAGSLKIQLPFIYKVLLFFLFCLGITLPSLFLLLIPGSQLSKPFLSALAEDPIWDPQIIITCPGAPQPQPPIPAAAGQTAGSFQAWGACLRLGPRPLTPGLSHVHLVPGLVPPTFFPNRLWLPEKLGPPRMRLT